MYNKTRFNKINDKKILHKVKKQWIVVSLSLFMLIGGGAIATHLNASANINQNKNNVVVNNHPTIISNAKNMHKNLLSNAASKANVDNNQKSQNTAVTKAKSKILVNNKHATKVQNINKLHQHTYGDFKGHIYNRIKVPFNKLTMKSKIKLHSSVDFNNSHQIGKLQHGKSVKINRAYREFGRYNNYLRYELKLAKNHDAFITGNNNNVAYVLPSKNYKYYQKRINKLLNKSEFDKSHKIRKTLRTLNHKRAHNYQKYADLYKIAFNAQQRAQYPIDVNYNNEKSSSVDQTTSNTSSNSTNNSQISQSAQRNDMDMSSEDYFIPSLVAPTSTSSSIMNMNNSTNSNSISSISSQSASSLAPSSSSMSINSSDDTITSSSAKTSIKMNNLMSNMNSQISSMSSSASVLAQQNARVSNNYSLFQSYNNDINAESNAYNTNNNFTQSYLNIVQSKKAVASSENINYLATKDTSETSSLGTLVLNNINAASNNASLAYSAANVSTSIFNQEMSNISHANSEYINMQNNTPTSLSSVSTSLSTSTNTSNVKINQTQFINNKSPKLPLKLGSVVGSRGFNINTLNKTEIEKLYTNEVNETHNVQDKIQQLKDQHYYHNKELYDTTFGSVPNNADSNTPSGRGITLTPMPLVPKEDNFVTSDLNINDKQSLPVPITTPLHGNNNNLVGVYANAEGTGGINATLYPNGTFLMNGGTENTGYFSPATMKIGWSDTNDDQFANDDHVDKTNTEYNGGAPYSKYNSDVISENFSDVNVSGDMYAQFAGQPQMKFFHMKNSNFSDTSNYSDFFGGDNNLQSIQFDNTRGIKGGPNTSSNNWHLINPYDWVDMSTGNTNSNDITNGDVWINKKNSPVYHIFSIPIEAHIHDDDGSVTTRKEYASVKGLLSNSTIINLSQLNLPDYKNISSGNAAVSFNINNNQFYYTNNGDTKNWTNTTNIDPTLIADFKPTYDVHNEPKSDSSQKLFSISDYIERHGGDKIGEFLSDNHPHPNLKYSTKGQIPELLTGSDVKTSGKHGPNWETIIEAASSLGASVLGRVENVVSKRLLQPGFADLLHTISRSTWKHIKDHALSSSMKDEFTEERGAKPIVTIANTIWKDIKEDNPLIHNQVSDITSFVGDIVMSFIWKYNTQTKGNTTLKITPFGNIEFTSYDGLIHKLDHYMKIPRNTIKGISDMMNDTGDDFTLNLLTSIITGGNDGEMVSWLTGLGETTLEPIINHYVNELTDDGIEHLPPLITIRF